MAPATADWTVYQIKAAVIAKGLTLKGISEGARLDPTACSVALRRRWLAAEQAIANALGIKPETIWPSRYSAAMGDPECRVGRPSRTVRRVRTAVSGATASEPVR
jgi:Ner family transcriptional regulator